MVQLVGAVHALQAWLKPCLRAALRPFTLFAIPARETSPAIAFNALLRQGIKGAGFARLLLALISIVFAASASATVITNTVNVTSSVNNDSDSAYVIAPLVRTNSSVSLLQYAPASGSAVNTVVAAGSYWNGSAYQAMPAVTDVGGSTIAIPGTVPLIAASGALKRGEPLFIKVNDPDQNNDPLVAETLVVTVTGSADSEQLRLTETGPNTGVFIIAIQVSPGAPTPNNGVLNMGVNAPITVSYTDATDAGDTSSQQLIVDPYGKVFDSTTGNAIDGASIRLVNTATGLDAVVYGDDGVSTFPATLTSGGSATDSGGTVYNFPTGSYRFPFVSPGTYQLQITPPGGYGAPSSVATATLQALPGAPFAIVTGSRGEIFTIDPGPAMEIDIPIDPTGATGLFVAKKAQRSIVAEGDFLQYQVDVTNTGAAALGSVTVTDRLPAGFRYQRGTARLDSSTLADPTISADGRTLTFSLGSVAASTKVNLRYVTALTANVKIGFATNSAQASSGAVNSNTASATVRVTEELIRSASQLLGRVSQNGCGPGKGKGVEGIRLYMEDGRFVDSDEQGQFHFEGIKPGSHVVQVDKDSLRGEFKVIACRSNTRNSGDPHSQFVDVRGGGIARVDFQLQRIGAPAPDRKTSASKPDNHAEGIVGLGNGSRLAQRHQTIIAVLRDGLKPRLLVDGKEVEKARIGFRAKNRQTGRTHYSYVGVDTGAPGSHTITFEGVGPFGNMRFRQQREIIRTGDVADIRVLKTEGNVADGRTPVRIKVKLLDDSGEEISGQVQLELQDGNLKPQPPDPEAVSSLSLPGNKLVVDADGYIRFAPVATSGSYHARLAVNDVVVDAHTYVQPHFRDWIMVGIAEGTLAYRQLSGNMQNLADAGLAEEFYKDGRLAFYAKGVVKGKWLMTAAFDSAKQKNLTEDGLVNGIDPDRYYTLYGDNSQQGFGAGSSDKLYLKMERDRFYAQYGDYDTGLTVTELSRYSRRLNGIKVEHQGKNLDINAFASEGGQAHARDEIRGRGVSGLYRLSNQNIVINSDRVSIEVRDRFRSHVVLSERKLTRHLDYNIDPIEGTLYFKEPVSERDPSFNPVYIVVDYETTDASASTAGGRAVYHSPDGKSSVGTTIVNEKTASGSATLTGFDARTHLNKQTEVVAEFAQTNGAGSDGTALKAEITHRNKQYDAKGYYRQQDANFGLGQTRGSESGTRKLGIAGRYRHNDKRATVAEYTHDEVTTTGAVRDMVDGRMESHEDGFDWSAGLRYVNETSGGGTAASSSLLTGAISKQFMNRRMDFRANTELALQPDGSNDFPSKLLLGADYRLTQNIQLFAEQEFTYNATQSSNMTRSGIKAVPWSGATVSSSVQQQSYGEGSRALANVGLTQNVNLRPGLDVDFSLDHAATIGSSGAPFNVNVPPVSGTVGDDYTAVGGGLTYRQKLWSGTGRIEFRDGEQEDKTSVIGGLYRQVTPGMGLSASVRYFDALQASSNRKTSTDLRFGLAYRPSDSRWMVLNRLDLVDSADVSSAENRKSNKIVNNLAAHYQVNDQSEVELQFGYKTVTDNFDGISQSGDTMLLGGEYRFDINPKWDVGVQMTTLQSAVGNNTAMSYGISGGWSFAPKMWMSFGYNFDGFTDNDFTAASYTAQGVYVKFRFAMDQNNARKVLAFWE